MRNARGLGRVLSEVSPSDSHHGDMGDQAVATLAVHVALGTASAVEEYLREREMVATNSVPTSRLCRDCGQEIGVARLRAKPMTSLCKDCKEKQG